MWEQKIHAKSSLPRKQGQFSLFIGRWQPLHDGHKALFDRVLENGGNVCIAIRDVEPDEKNPFHALDVLANIQLEYQEIMKEGRVRAIIIPDLCSVEFGRGVGYDIVEHIPPTEIGDISATKIREQLKQQGKL
jgi:nicotinamide mononucleotide adenylyltransferase